MKLLLILLTTFIPFTAFLQKTGTLVLLGDADYYGYDKSEFIVHYNQEVLGRFDKEGNFSYSTEQKGPFIIKHPDFESLTVTDISFSKKNPSQSVFLEISPEAEKRLFDKLKDEQVKTCTGSSKNDLENSTLTADSLAQFPGGDPDGLNNFIRRNLVYPHQAVEQGIMGKVYISFIVEADGSVTCVEIKKSVDYLLDREAFRCIRKLPRFKPATSKGVPVATFYLLPITFNLE